MESFTRQTAGLWSASLQPGRDAREASALGLPDPGPASIVVLGREQDGMRSRTGATTPMAAVVIGVQDSSGSPTYIRTRDRLSQSPAYVLKY